MQVAAVSPTESTVQEGRASRCFSSREERILLALAEAAIPEGHFLEGGGPGTLERLYRLLDGAGESRIAAVRALLWTAEMAPLPLHGRTLSSLDRNERELFLVTWERSRSHALRSVLRALLLPLKAAHFDEPRMLAHVGCKSGQEPRPLGEPARWKQQIVHGREVTEDLHLECEVVVIGTGAGGAAAAYELARRGRAVLVLEEGEFFERKDFDGRAATAYKKMYRDQGITVALGNVGIPLWTGRAVGGSTIINSGTCYRAPERTLRYWREKHGLHEFSSETLAPYYERVEAMLEVAEADRRYLGQVAEVIARGATRLGLSHGPLRRNAPGCDGQGVCCFGCPTGAKRSTDRSYIPQALERGAQLITGARVFSIDVVAGKARGVRAKLASGHELRVAAQAVVVAGGALMTPLLLKRSGLCGMSGYLGKNLSIHPASKVLAVFDETIDMTHGIPQGYFIDSLADEGLLFEGASVPLDVASLGVPWVGKRFTELMEQYRNIALFGFMLQDHSRGEVREGPNGSPLVLYNLSKSDALRMKKGFEVLCEVFLAAGAKRVLPFLVGLDEVRSERDLEALRSRKLRPGDFEVTAFHPLGTARMGVDPRRSVVGPDHEAHDVERLYVCDGSVMPSSLGVNPQMTIMALSLRAAEIIDARLR